MKRIQFVVQQLKSNGQPVTAGNISIQSLFSVGGTISEKTAQEYLNEHESATNAKSVVLWQNKNWSIERISDSELIISNYNDLSYAYVSADFTALVVDRAIFPKYIQRKALALAKRHIKSIYA